jgi:hypothetical protein
MYWWVGGGGEGEGEGIKYNLTAEYQKPAHLALSYFIVFIVIL